MTGHTLMVGEMGRTELASSTEEGAGQQAFVEAMVRDIPLSPPNAAANRSTNLGRPTDVESPVTAP